MDSQSLAVYDFLLDELIVDVAQACHRQAKTGAHAAELGPGQGTAGQTAGPPRLQPLPPGPGVRGPVDVFGQSHPAKSTDVVTCKNCGRQVQAGTFAPHLEKCMGKGRAAARAASRRIQGQV